MESAGHGCLATADATGAQTYTKCFGKKEKATRLAFSTRFRRDMRMWFCFEGEKNHNAEKLVHAFMTSRLDYCNALLGGCPASSINKLQVVQNAAARVLTRSRKYDHITPILQSLHWLPIKYRIS